MMKNVIFMLLMGLVAVFTSATAGAMEISSLSGKTYKAYIYCTGKAGDFCGNNEVVNDRFNFDGSDFEIGSMDDALWGYGADGDYNDNGLSFNADFEAINEGLEKYKFTIRVINLFDEFILGTMEIKYYEWDIIDFDKEDEADAYFVGAGFL